MSTKILNIPDLGEAEDVEVIEICVKEGDKVDSDIPILVLESDKAAMEIPASIAGTVISLKVSLGDKVGAGLYVLDAPRREGCAGSSQGEKPKKRSSGSSSPGITMSSPRRSRTLFENCALVRRRSVAGSGLTSGIGARHALRGAQRRPSARTWRNGTWIFTRE